MKTTQVQALSLQEMNAIKNNVKLRNQVANAHTHTDSEGKFKFLGTCAYPESNKRTVTNTQRIAAIELRKRQAKEIMTKHKNDLIFVGMGSDYQAKYKDDVCNHRIRTEFLNSVGRRFFVEFGTARDYETTRCDHSIDRDLEIKYMRNGSNDQPYNNYAKLERRPLMKYTKTNILHMVNNAFGCNFKNIIIDSGTVSIDKDPICFSPK